MLNCLRYVERTLSVQLYQQMITQLINILFWRSSTKVAPTWGNFGELVLETLELIVR